MIGERTANPYLRQVTIESMTEEEGIRWHAYIYACSTCGRGIVEKHPQNNREDCAAHVRMHNNYLMDMSDE